MINFFIDILSEYKLLKTLPYQPTKYNEVALILEDAPKAIIKELNLDEAVYKVQGSVGAGRWTDTPWISIFAKDITETAQEGFYIVYLFRKDLKGFYLSLNQGTTYITKKYKGKKPRTKMKKVAESLRENLIYDNKIFPLEEIDLVANTDNAKNYMAAHICGKYYDASSMPSKEQFVSDLKLLIEVYSGLKLLMANKSTEEMLDFHLQREEIEDTQYQSDVLVAPLTATPKKPQSVPTEAINKGKKGWKRNSSIAKEALQNENFLCEIDPNHLTFRSEVTNENFVEAHHLIPMKQQHQFSWSLDVPGNIASLCPNCHRRIHHANKKDRKGIVKKLYDKKVNELDVYGIDISLEELFNYYGC